MIASAETVISFEGLVRRILWPLTRCSRNKGWPWRGTAATPDPFPLWGRCALQNGLFVWQRRDLVVLQACIQHFPDFGIDRSVPCGLYVVYQSAGFHAG